MLQVGDIVRVPSDWPLSNDILTYRACLITLHLVVSMIDYLYFEVREQRAFFLLCLHS